MTTSQNCYICAGTGVAAVSAPFDLAPFCNSSMIETGVIRNFCSVPNMESVHPSSIGRKSRNTPSIPKPRPKALFMTSSPHLIVPPRMPMACLPIAKDIVGGFTGHFSNPTVELPSSVAWSSFTILVAAILPMFCAGPERLMPDQATASPAAKWKSAFGIESGN
jgi:hypothetical protein